MPTTAVTTAALAETSSGPLTLVANTEQVINFDTDLGQVEVATDSLTAVVYVSVNKTAATVGGKHCYPILVGTGYSTIDVPTPGNTQVRLITTGTGTAWVNAPWDPRNG